MKNVKAFVIASSAGIIVAGLAGCGADHAATAHVAAAKQSTAGNPPAMAPQSVRSSAVKRVSFRCKSPASQFLNISYQPSWNTKFYFNNHCAQKRRITITQSGWPGSDSFTVNPHTKGNKTFYMGHNSAIHVTSS